MAIHAGSWFGLPDFGITEKIQSYINPSAPLTSQGGSNLFGSTSAPATNNYNYPPAPTNTTKTPPPSGAAPAPAPAGSVLGVGTTDQTGGSGVNWDEIYKPAFDALSSAEQSAQSSNQEALSQAGTSAADTISGLKSEEASRLANFGQQRTGETKRTESAVAEARRMAAQLLQGLQSQYGGSTGTGAFRGEQVGAAATQNIAGNREALQTALAGIAQSESALKDKVLQEVTKTQRWLEDKKIEAKAELDRQLQSISAKRGELNVQKGTAMQEALNSYRETINEANKQARDYQYKVQLEAQQHANTLAEIKARQQPTFSANLSGVNFQNGQQTAPATQNTGTPAIPQGVVSNGGAPAGFHYGPNGELIPDNQP